MKSYLVPNGYFQYALPSKAPTNQPLIYLPFWRFKGMFFSCGPTGVEHKFMDLSYQAIEAPVFPISIGFRGQALKLKFVTSDLSGRFLSPVVPLQKVMEKFTNRFTDRMPKPILHSAHIGESLSLVYSPYYLNGLPYDAVLNEPLSSPLPDDFDIDALRGGNPEKSIHFLPTLCPHCGWDLSGDRDSLVLLCKNCNSAWTEANQRFKKIRIGHIPDGHGNVMYMPFWRIKADVSGIELSSYADLVRVANLPKVVQDEWEKIGFRFWAPAFKVRPNTFLRLLKDMTLAQSKEPLDTALPEGRAYSVNLPIQEALETIKINLATFIRPKQRMQKHLEAIQVKPASFILVYVPFLEKHHDFTHTSAHVSINKNQLRLSKNL